MKYFVLPNNTKNILQANVIPHYGKQMHYFHTKKDFELSQISH